MASPPRSWPPAPPPVWAPWEGEGMPRVGYVAALAPLKAWPREVWPETEDLEAVCPVSSGSRQCQVRDRRTGSLGLQTPWSPEREVLLELRAAFWFILQSGFGANGNLEAWPGWGRGTLMCQVWAAGCNNRRFPKARASKAKGARWPVSCCEPASDGVPWTGVLASLAQETSLLPMGSAHHTIPMQPGVWMGVGSLHCPSRYVNKGKKMSSQKPRVPQLETLSSRCGWGSGGNISDGRVGTKGGLSPRAQPAFLGSSKSSLVCTVSLSSQTADPSCGPSGTDSGCQCLTETTYAIRGSCKSLFADTHAICVLCICMCACA